MHPNIPQCRYIRTDGRRCGSPALKGQRFCYYHYEANRPTVNLDIAPLEDGNAIQVALLDIIRAVADERLDIRKATTLGYLLQTAAANLKNVHFGFHRHDMITDLPAQDPLHRGTSPEGPHPERDAVEKRSPTGTAHRSPALSALGKEGQKDSYHSAEGPRATE